MTTRRGGKLTGKSLHDKLEVKTDKPHKSNQIVENSQDLFVSTRKFKKYILSTVKMETNRNARRTRHVIRESSKGIEVVRI